MTFKNKHFTTRNYECTNVVFCQADHDLGDDWVPCDASEIEAMGCQQLATDVCTVDGEIRRATLFGWL